MKGNFLLLIFALLVNCLSAQEGRVTDMKYNSVVNYIKHNSFEFSKTENIYGENYNRFVLNYLKGAGAENVKQLIKEHAESDLPELSNLVAAELGPNLKEGFLLKVKASYKELDKSKCLEYREGKFEAFLDNIDKNISIIRTGNQQVEIVDGEKYFFQINWISDCECEFKSVTSFADNTQMSETEVVVTRIYEINEGFYKTLSLGKETGMMSDLNIRFLKN